MQINDSPIMQRLKALADAPAMQRLKSIAEVPMSKLPSRDKVYTAACRTPEGIEWTHLVVKKEGSESSTQGAFPCEVANETLAEALTRAELPEEVAEALQGDIKVPMQTSELLMRTMVFPTADNNEIAEMVRFQIEKLSPFPSDQIAISHEIARQDENSSLVLMVATKRKGIDAIGEAFRDKGVHVHSIDVRVLGWLQLMRDEGHVPDEGCHIFIIADSIDFTLAVLSDGVPLAFRSLHDQADDADTIDELCQQMGYTLTALDAEHDLPNPASIQFWNLAEKPDSFFDALAAKCGLEVVPHDLGTLPPLSEGILRRALTLSNRIELIPKEWIELQQRKRMVRKFSIISGSIAAVWIFVLLVFFSIYKARDIKLAHVKREASAIAPAAQQAFENREKLKALRVYADRSDSSLECLREVTRMLPNADIEFGSFNYKKNKAVSLRGTAASDDIAYNYFGTLNTSKLFTRLKDQSVTTKVTKGIRRAVFAATLELPAGEGGE